MTHHALPTRKLADRTDLEQLRQQAQDLLEQPLRIWNHGSRGSSRPDWTARPTGRASA